MSKKNDVHDDMKNKKDYDSVADIDISIPKKDSDIVFNEVYKKKYFSFEARVGMMIFFIVFCFTIAGVFIFKSFDFSKEKSIVDSEDSFVNYEVCLKDSNVSCLDEDMEYFTSYVDTLETSFKYVLNYTEEVSYKYYYYVIGKVKIYDQMETDKVIYKDEDVLVSRTKVDGTSNQVDFSVVTSVPFSKYNTYIDEYKSKNLLNGPATLEVSLYVEDNDKSKKVSSLLIPLSSEKFSIDKEFISDGNGGSKISNGDLSGDVDVFYATVAVLFSLVGLLIVIKLTNLVCKVVNSGSNYQKRLRQILRCYDKIIVTARKGYIIDSDKELVKVKSFDCLLDVRESLEKPIVYVKVNNIKSEFYVENKDKVYRYTMKDVDMEGS